MIDALCFVCKCAGEVLGTFTLAYVPQHEIEDKLQKEVCL